jgi:hypothetical protein
MRLFVFLLVAGWFSPSPAAKPSARFDFESSLGGSVGECAVVRCLIFRGVFLSDTPQSGRQVSVRVSEWLFGKTGSAGEVVDLPFAAPDGMAAKDGVPLYLVWNGVSVSKNAPVTVILPLDRIGFRNGGEPLAVVTEDSAAKVVAYLAAEAARVKATPDYLSTVVASLRGTANPALGGLAVEALLYGSWVKDFDLLTGLLSDLVGNPSVSPQHWAIVTVRMGTFYQQVSAVGKDAIIRRFIDLGRAVDPDAAVAGIQGLCQLSEGGLDLAAILPSSDQARLVEEYRTLLREKKVSRNRVFEAALGSGGEVPGVRH